MQHFCSWAPPKQSENDIWLTWLVRRQAVNDRAKDETGAHMCKCLPQTRMLIQRGSDGV